MSMAKQLNFKQETFRDDYTYSNSAEAIRRFPFPFAEDEYMYSVNIEQHNGGAPGAVFEHAIDVDEHYVAECADRAITLDDDPQRYIAATHDGRTVGYGRAGNGFAVTGLPGSVQTDQRR